MSGRRVLFWFFGPAAGCLVSMLLVPVFILLIILSSVAALKGQSINPSTSGVNPQQSMTGFVWSGKKNQAVVNAALSMTPYLRNNAREYVEGFPQAALDYWSEFCPWSSGCWEDWQNGNVQCVMFVFAAYGLAGQDLPSAPDAVFFWRDYQDVPGWLEIPNGTKTGPIPGDIIVWSDNGLGHVAIVLDVQMPTLGQAGSVTFGQANGPASIEQQPLTFDAAGNLTMQTWRGYTVLGYIRHVAYVS